MTDDTIEIKLPASGQTVTLRNYTTRKDDEKAEDVLYLGVGAEERLENGELKKITRFPLANVMASQDVYVRRLVLSIEGDSKNLPARLDEMRSEDYKAIQDAVEKVLEEHSPKVKEAKSASNPDTQKS